ncbi:MAG: PfkB family carbohydrate kinase [Sulfurovum sp.]|nr:PfkB family carbohydrate kinase [Sulfurovum sp.]
MIELKGKTPHIAVIGDLMIDHYLWGVCERISPEAPVQIVSIEKETSVLGGAGNVIHNLIALGAKIDVFSVLGDDENAEALKSLLHRLDISTKHIGIQAQRLTSKKSRIISSGQQILRYDKETTESIDIEQESQLIAQFTQNISLYDVVICI